LDKIPFHRASLIDVLSINSKKEYKRFLFIRKSRKNSTNFFLNLICETKNTKTSIMKQAFSGMADKKMV
jgi:epoxyqueuosine reductase QueG